MCVSLDDAPGKNPVQTPNESLYVRSDTGVRIPVIECPRCYAFVRKEHLAMHNVDGHS